VSIADRLALVRVRIERAALAARRDPAGITLVAVSKTRGPDAVREAFAGGQRAFGENYAQELSTKAAAVADLPGLEWHFIGHVQTNKAKTVARHARVVHTVDSPALARELARRAARERLEHGRAELQVLVEVNVSGEAQKAGAAPGEIPRIIDGIRESEALSLRGLMTVPPAGDLAAARQCFEALASLREIHGGTGVLPELSMGMSDDLEVAIACGATMVRVGTAIFGART
jgi:pyridoxal phosphate enzyme (YggS family)